MILIDAIYINSGGGKVLLDYLLLELEKTDTKFLYLLDERIRNNHPSIKSTNIIHYLKSDFFLRYRFYKENKFTFTKVLCFGNVPPPVRSNAVVYTYFHNQIYIKVPEDFSLLEKVKFKLKVVVLNLFKKNTDFFIAQTQYIKDGFYGKFKYNRDRILLVPFYPPFDSINGLEGTIRKGTFAYISNATSNKNHIRLIDAFCLFYDECRGGELILTVSENYPQILEIIKSKVEAGYPIKNIGFVKRNDLQYLYRTSEYLIFPSLAESFGLGLVEAIENDAKVIGADLPYTYAVCKPSVVFNPLNVDDIKKAIKFAFQNEVAKSEQTIYNEIETMISLLKEN